MLQNELFLKEISDFLRSCTVKNKYFAQMISNQVMDRYGFSELPDYFNPYYLHLFGLSTLDLKIPSCLIDTANGNVRVSNTDRIYKPIVGEDPEMTELMILRLDRYTDQKKSEAGTADPFIGKSAASTKVAYGIQMVKNNIEKLYLNALDYSDTFPAYLDTLYLENKVSKVTTIQSYLTNFASQESVSPKDDCTWTITFLGDYDWTDLITNSPVYNGSNQSKINNVNEIGSIKNPVVGQYVHVMNNQRTYQYVGNDINTNNQVWDLVPVNTMLDETIDYLRSHTAIPNTNPVQYLTSDRVKFITSSKIPLVAILGVVGDLDWDSMYGMDSSVKALQLTSDKICFQLTSENFETYANKTLFCCSAANADLQGKELRAGEGYVATTITPDQINCWVSEYIGSSYPVCSVINGTYQETTIQHNLEFSHMNYYVMQDKFTTHYETLQQIDGYIHPPSTADENGNQTDESTFGPLIDVDYADISTSLGYNSSNLPKAGVRVNYMSNSRAWKYVDTDAKIDLHYFTKHILNSFDLSQSCIYENKDCTQLASNITFENVEGTGNNTILTIKLNGKLYQLIRDPENDSTLKHCTYEFNGTSWIEINVINLFKDEWSYQWNKSCKKYKKLSYILMSNYQDKESFDEKLLWKKNSFDPSDKSLAEINRYAVVELDRWEYTSWDKPIYVPTYDHPNTLTDDFTLYTRLCNTMRVNHIRTSLKYFIGASLYEEVQEANPTSMDYVKGIFYPVENLSEISLNTFLITDNGSQLEAATVDDYNAYTSAIRTAMDKAIVEYNGQTPVAPNFTLLRYDSTLLEEQEAETIIDAIRKTLTVYRERFDLKEFGYEELYYAAVWATIWQQLPLTILTQRIKNLRTEAVHTTHIWEFLKSRGLGDYRTVLDKDQQIFLYKNIDYLRGNEGKQSTFKILSEKLLSKFSAEIRTKSVLLDTTEMRDNEVKEDNVLGVHLINGLTKSVSANVVMLSEDLDEATAVIADTTGRIEDFDDIYRREYNSGLVPKYGDTQKEQQQRVGTSHDEIEVKKHSYAPTKLAEITRGKIMQDLARISMSFIIQTLVRKLSGSEISNKCVVNVQFEGLGEPKTFTVGECLALIFYAIRKRDWYTFHSKLGSQNFNKSSIWKGVSSFANDEERITYINNLNTFETCPKSSSLTYESDCDHSYYNASETFNDSIPSTASIWLPYLGNYEDVDGNTVELNLPQTKTAIESLIGNPKIYLRGASMRYKSTIKNLLSVVNPYLYTSEELLSWNDMCAAEDSIEANNRTYDYLNWSSENHCFEYVTASMPDNVKVKYDYAQEVYYKERLKFNEISNTIIGGIISGSSNTRLTTDSWYMNAIPYPEQLIQTHTDLITFLNNQVAIFIKHFLMVRNSSDFYFHQAMSMIYNLIQVNDVVALHLVEGYTKYSEWFDGDVELKSAFREIEAGTDQVSVYNSVIDNLVSALFPEDKISSSSGIDLTKYNAIKQLFQEMCSYNIAFLNTSSISYECLYLHPITINCRQEVGVNQRYSFQSRKKTFTGNGSIYDKLEYWATEKYYPILHKSVICIRSFEMRYLVACESTDEGAFPWVENENNSLYYKWESMYNVPTIKVLTLVQGGDIDQTNGHLSDPAIVYLLTVSNVNSVIGKIRYIGTTETGPFEYRAITSNDVGKYITNYFGENKSYGYVEEEISNTNVWNSSTITYVPTEDLTFKENITYYLKQNMRYNVASVVVGEPIPFNNLSGANETEEEKQERYDSYKKSYLVLGSKKDTQVYYVRKAV